MVADVLGRRDVVGEMAELKSNENLGFSIMEDGTPVGLDG